jgi:hypothetical protein
MRSLRLAAVSLLLVCAPMILTAQSFSVGGGGMYASLNGSDFAGINAGLGVEAQLRYHAKGGISVGGGFQYTSHGIDGFSEHYGVRGLFADVRYAFESPSTSSLTPYLGARVALAHYGISSGGSTLSANGTAFGPTGGLLIRLNPSTQFDVGVAWFSIHFGDADLDGTTQPDTKSNGSALALRAGVVFGFGKK